MKKIVIALTLLAVTVFLTAALASCSCGDEVPAVTSTEMSSSLTEGSDTAPETTAGKTPIATDTKPVVTTTAILTVGTTPDSTSTKLPGSTSVTTPGITPDSTTGTASTGTDSQDSTGKLPASPVAPSTEKADESGKISLTYSDIKSGLLLVINEDNKYDTDVNPLFTGDRNMTAEDAIKAGFTHISTVFRTVDSNHFLRNEAMAALVALMQTFDAAVGTDNSLRVDGYKAEFARETDASVTGNVLKLRILQDDGVCGLNNLAYKVSLDGKMVTYDKWFEANAAKYGFIYEGLVDDPTNAAGQLRYVGTIHSLGIKEAGSLTAYIDAIKAGTITSVVVGEDTWKLSYVKLSQGESIEQHTEIVVGANATYTISGDNKEGVIVAVKGEAEK